MVIVITGASSGFGKGAALKFAEKECTVVLAARRTELLEEIVRQCEKKGAHALAVTTDVANASDVENLAKTAIEKFGHIDVWINNAGVGVIGRFEDAPLEDYSRLIDVNLKGVVFGSHVALCQFRKQKFGTLINIGSVDSELPLAYQACYSATKAGVLSLGRVLNEEIRLNEDDRGIKVCTIMPYAVDTPWWQHAANYSGHEPQMAGMEDPEKVITTIVDAAYHPKTEISVGWKAKGTNAAHRFMPGLAERLGGKMSEKYQVNDAPKAPHTTASLHEPMSEGTGVEGNVRAQMSRQ